MLPGARWSQSQHCWYVPFTADAYAIIKERLAKYCQVQDQPLSQYLESCKKWEAASGASVNKIPGTKTTTSSRVPMQVGALSKENRQAWERFIEQLKLKAYSSSTIRTYSNEFIQLLRLLKKKPVETLTVDDLRRYMLYCREQEGIKESTAHSRLNALKFYFEQVLHKDKFFFELPRPKKEQLLPKVFSQDEVAAIIKSVDNKKHKTMLMLAYGAGLRVSEVVHLKTTHIDSGRMSILVAAAKGKKDRLVSLSPVLLVMMREYAKLYKPDRKGWLFEGSIKGNPYSSRSLQEVLQQAKEKAGIVRPGSMHSLRHSFATHLVEKGTDVTMIQKLLGHNDIKTTMIYLHTSNKDLLKVISPLDSLKLD
jgi:site-specific recombinase XerD